MPSLVNSNVGAVLFAASSRSVTILLSKGAQPSSRSTSQLSSWEEGGDFAALLVLAGLRVLGDLVVGAGEDEEAICLRWRAESEAREDGLAHRALTLGSKRPADELWENGSRFA